MLVSQSIKGTIILYTGNTIVYFLFFFFQAEDGIRDGRVTGVQTCALPISSRTKVAELQQRVTRARVEYRKLLEFCWLTGPLWSTLQKRPVSLSRLRVAELVAQGAKVESDFRTLYASILAHILAHPGLGPAGSCQCFFHSSRPCITRARREKRETPPADTSLVCARPEWS